MFGFSRSKLQLVEAADALPGRSTPIERTKAHYLTGRSFDDLPEGTEQVLVAMGCFWGAERKYWKQEGATWTLAPGIVCTAVGYAGGHTPNPTYEEVCSGRTAHTEVVRVAYNPAVIALPAILGVFWESHDPTQFMRQGNDVGTQYRSAIYAPKRDQLEIAHASRDRYQARLTAAGFGEITTEIAPAGPFYFAETYHQQYLAKNPNGYCGLGGTGVSCPVALST